jgi:superfamily II RNA helicase
MVKICSQTYPSNNEEKYSSYFEKYPYKLSDFQKYAVEAIIEGHHILVTAHTGSGKTMPAEFAIEHFVSMGKKVIYTSPIKALSNQKFYEFTQKFPHISFGILTGDIKSNPEADVLIMTTEILMNTLYMKKHKTNTNDNNNVNLALFEMDFDNELACVVFDEVHYINDEDRGRVWEETILMLPQHVQMVMLSATLDSPEKFALWCETKGEYGKETEKKVYLTATNFRIVPLTHYSYITCTSGLFKTLKDKTLEMEVMKVTNSLHTIQDAKGNFNEDNYLKIKKTLDLFNNKNHFVKRQHILNSVSKFMVQNNMLPAICFVLSRKALEQCAKEITCVLLEDDSKVPYIVRRECEQIIRKLPNYQEYLELPEYVNMVSLLEKGIGIHHAGIMPVLREMVELLFSKGYIKLLFATETFAVGINMPTKTVLFTSVQKFDGTGQRMLYSHEYTQMAGRAGRRGIDTIGNVIHLTNLFKGVDMLGIKTMMKGQPQKLVSKFRISYNLLLNLIDIGELDYSKYSKKSMIQGDIDNQIGEYYQNISKLEGELQKLELTMKHCKTPKDIVDNYIELTKIRQTSVNKKRKDAERSLQKIQDEYRNIENDVQIVKKYNDKLDELTNQNDKMSFVETFIERDTMKVLDLLEKQDFIKRNDDSEHYELTLRGKIAIHLREVHCLIFTDMILSNKLKNLTCEQLVSVFSCFTNISVSEEFRSQTPSYCLDSSVKDIVAELEEKYKSQHEVEIQSKINTGMDYNMHFDLLNYVIKWCETENVIECKELIDKMCKEKEIFLGEFVKAILKINNISSEMEKVAEYLGEMEFLSKLRQISNLTLKFVATNQSLYV